MAAAFATVSIVSGLIILERHGEQAMWPVIAMFVIGGLCISSFVLALLPLSETARGWLSEALSLFMILAYLAPLLYSTWGPPMQDPTLSVFRPTYGFAPFVYLGLVLLSPTQAALWRAWAFLVLQLVITLGGIAWHDALDFQRDSMVALLLWLTVGNVFFVFMLHGLAFYARALRRSEKVIGAATALRDNEERLQLVLRSIQAGAWGWVFEPPGGRWVSPRFCELLGWDAADPEAPRGVTGIVHADDLPAMAVTVTTQLQQSNLFDVTARLRLADGEYRWFNIRGHVARAADGAIREIVGAISDVDGEVQSKLALQSSRDKLEYLAYHDALTGLYNRRYALQHLEHEIGHAQRNRESLSLAIIDIDHFKPYNDHLGHAAGDEALQTVAHELAKAARRDVDVVSRHGGEEFLLILPGTDAAGGMAVAQRACQSIFDAGLPHPRAPLMRVTVSIGITTTPDAAGRYFEADLLLEEADAALYRAKSASRNTVRHYLDAINQDPEPN